MSERWLGKNSHMKKIARELRELKGEMGIIIHGSLLDIKLDYGPIILK